MFAQERRGSGPWSVPLLLGEVRECVLQCPPYCVKRPTSLRY